MLNRKAQAPELSTILIVAVLIVIVVVTYTWGKALFDEQQTRTATDYMQTKFFEIKRAVLAVAGEGLNSSRVVRLDLSEGTLYINNGTFCLSTTSGGNIVNERMDRNSLVYNITTKSNLVSSDNYTSIDPVEGNASCDAALENNSIAVLMGKSEKAGNSYANSYALWFRNLTQENGANDNYYVINITTNDTKTIGEGSHTLVIRNVGTLNSSYRIYTTVRVDVV